MCGKPTVVSAEFADMAARCINTFNYSKLKEI